MPSFAQYSAFLFFNVCFIITMAILLFYTMSAQSKQDATLRCNPVRLMFSNQLSKDLTYCMNDSMPSLLAPVYASVGQLGALGGELTNSLNDTRQMISFVRSSLTGVASGAFGSFTNLAVEFDKVSIGIRDMLAKMVGIVTVLTYTLRGSVLTMQSLYNGTFGDMLRTLSGKSNSSTQKTPHCFQSDTLLADVHGHLHKISEIPIGTQLAPCDRTTPIIVTGVLQLQNSSCEPFYCIQHTQLTKTKTIPIYVTGQHFVQVHSTVVPSTNNDNNTDICWMRVSDISNNKNNTQYVADKTNLVAPIVWCLLTNTGVIPIPVLTSEQKQAGYVDFCAVTAKLSCLYIVFSDWEDDHLVATVCG